MWPIIRLAMIIGALAAHSIVAEDSWEHFENGGMFQTSSPAISQRRDFLVYATPCTGHGDIYTVDGTNTRPVRLTDSPEFESSPLLFPDEKHILYCREAQGRRHLWIMTIAGESQTQLTVGDVLDTPLAVSATGSSVLFQRTVASNNAPKIPSAYLMFRANNRPAPRRVGLAAIFMPTSQFVVYTDDLQSFSRLDLMTRNVVRAPQYGSGWPLSFSRDGRYLLTTRPVAGQGWSLDQELWVRDVKQSSEWKIGLGHSAVILGTDEFRVLYFEGYRKSPFVCDIEGRSRTLVDCGMSHKSHPRICSSGGVILGGFLRTGEPDFVAYYLASNALTARRIAAISCSRWYVDLPMDKSTRQ